MSKSRMGAKRAVVALALTAILGTTGAVTHSAITAAPAAAATANCDGWGRHVWAKASGYGVTINNCSLYSVRVQPEFFAGTVRYYNTCKTIPARSSYTWSGSLFNSYTGYWRYC